MDESGTNEAESHWKVVSGRNVTGAIRFRANAGGLQLKCTRLLHDVWQGDSDMER